MPCIMFVWVSEVNFGGGMSGMNSCGGVIGRGVSCFELEVGTEM